LTKGGKGIWYCIWKQHKENEERYLDVPKRGIVRLLSRIKKIKLELKW
jgi:hypothetical protein